MSTAAALQAPIASEPVLDALRALGQRTEPDLRPAFKPTSQPADVAIDIERPRSSNVATTTRAEPRAVTWMAPAESLWLLALKNYGLTLATFGIYHFWGRAEMNRKMVNAVHVNGKPLDYRGTGREGFVSFVLGGVIAVALVTTFYSVVMLNKGHGGGSFDGVRQFRWQRLFISLPLLFLLGSITYRKRQHILRRTWINGLRFDLSGHPWSYAWRHFITAFTVPLTLGWSTPWRMSMLEARKIGEMHHGVHAFKAAPDMRRLYKAFAALWFGGGTLYFAMLIMLGALIGNEIMAAVNGLTVAPLLNPHVAKTGAMVIGVAVLPLAAMLLTYKKAWLEHQVSSIAFARGRMRLDMPLWRYLALAFGGMALTVISLGCFKPVVRARQIQFIIDHLVVEGELDLDTAPLDQGETA